MKLPNGDRAGVPDEKLMGYLLNEDHEEQPGHAVLFRTLLDIDQTHAGRLKAALLEAAAHAPARPGQPSPYGRKFEIRFPMTGPRGDHTIISIWLIEHGSDAPKLVTAFVE